ncbi:MAG: hypothetical protein O6934_12830 [SAR324 cluster bacterium]|nr:hypothetical protein [SAR324 cluster bacterium]MCZ6645373.1 hypothetical protein [SAR324 cluster bacterium]MCZ6730569.1 hypothetical protein [SAR324 cluster bacterium]MCZ6843154.1 hypothetical protein [SAR324 cluster bacterium]
MSAEATDPRDAAGLIEFYYEKGWSDGLPVVPPSEDSVGAMLAAGGVQGDEVVGVVSARNTRVTADKVAINAVMAGCLPEYMPVVLSAVRGLTDPRFAYHGIATSTGGASVVIIVNGPITRQLGINGEDNAFGPGFRPNVTIGRALRLLMMNAINTRPGKLDRSTLGNPGKISFCFAENEAGSPWEPLHVERGLKPEQSATTLFAADGVYQTYNQLSATPEPLLYGMADAIANLGARAIVGQPDAVIVFGAEHVKVLRDNGWSKQQVKQCLFEHARQSVAELKKAGRLPGGIEPGDEQAWQHVVKEPEDFIVVCAGGRVGNWSACLSGWGSRQGSRAVTTPVEVS